MRICIEVDVEEGLLETIKLKVDDWTHIEVLDYDQLPFKCRHYHGYGNFARHCKKKSEDGAEDAKGDQWTQVQKPGTVKQSNRNKGKSKFTGSGVPPET